MENVLQIVAVHFIKKTISANYVVDLVLIVKEKVTSIVLHVKGLCNFNQIHLAKVSVLMGNISQEVQAALLVMITV